jgi:hypothetical protein
MDAITKKRPESARLAIGFAKLWRNGKMIGADEYEVCESLLREVERLEEIIKNNKGGQ